MIAFAAGLLLGTLPLARIADVPPTDGALAVLLPALLLLALRRQRLVAGLGLGLGLALLAADAGVERTLDGAHAGADLVVEGRVIGLPERDGRRSRFRLQVESARAGGEPVDLGGRVRLAWYGEDRPALAPGQRWRLPVRLEPPRGFANPHTFDYALWLFREGIRATGYVRTGAPRARLSPAGPSLDAVRDRLRAGLVPLLPDGPGRGVLLALALGHREHIDRDQWSVLRATGTTHLVAISGLHIGLIAWVGFRAGGLAWRLLGRARGRCPRPVVQACTGIAAASVYAALAGFALPTVRALVMLAVALATVVLRRRARAGEGLATALVAVLLFDPLAPLGASFWLSFVAVAAILLLVTGRVGPAPRVRRWILLQAGIALALPPLLLGLFGQASLVAPAANLVAIPWVSLAVVPPTLAATALAPAWPAAAGWLFAAADSAFRPLWWLLESLAAWPAAAWHAPSPPPLLVALAAAGAAVLALPRGTPGRLAGAAALLPLLLWQPEPPAPGALRFRLLDVGQGLAAVVRTRDHVLVYDAGARFSADFDAGSAVVVPHLRARGIDRIDALVVSHGDNDHAGGAAAVRTTLQPRRTWSGTPYALDFPARLCARGQRWQWDGVEFRFLHPSPDDALTGNDASCVLRVQAPGGTLLLPGDIEAPAERRVLARAASPAADVVVAPHHGSDTSSTEGFVAAADPDWVLYPVGHRNRWGFPAPSVRARWRPAAQRTTACSGSIAFAIHPRTGVSSPRGWRREAPRFWRAGCAGRAKSGTMRADVKRPEGGANGG